MTCRCGFKAGDRVKMMSGLTKLSGEPFGEVFGTVEDWPEEKCHIVQWKATGTATPTTNPNVKHAMRPKPA